MIFQVLCQVASWILSIPDALFPLLNILPGGPRFFSGGYGNTKIYFNRRNNVIQSLSNGTSMLNSSTIQLVQSNRDGGIVLSNGQFQSPVAKELPKEAQTCYFKLVEPDVQSSPQQKQKNKVYVVMFPATGEMGSSTRLAMAKKLALKQGWSSVIITAPFYGKRKPSNQKLFFIDSVTNILLQSQAIIEEGLLITSWLMDKSEDALVCHTGFSYGAAMCTCTSAISLAAGLDGNRLSCAPYVGCSSPNTLADGVLESGIDWNALTKKPNEAYEIKRKRLYDLFDETQLTALAKQAQGRKLAVARGVSFSNDGFIRPVYAKALEFQLEPISASPVTFQWYPGGHAIGALLRPYLQQRLIEKTVQELEASRQN